MTLSLPEELVLLAFDERGSMEKAAWASLDYGVGGAVIGAVVAATAGSAGVAAATVPGST